MAYDQKILEIMCRENITVEKTFQLKEKTLVAALRKELFLPA